MKILLFSDLHVYSHKNSQKRLNDCLECLEWALRTSREREIKNVFFLGDLFHDRQKIVTLAYQRVYEILKDFFDLNIFLLVGNHDMWFSDLWDIISIKPFGALSHVEIIDKPTTMEIGNLTMDIAPYAHDPVGMLAGFKKKSRVLLGHLAVDQALLNFVYHTTADVEIESDKDMIRISTQYFSGWEKVFLGHYHGSQILDNVEYVGSPMELTYNETFQEKHLILLDTQTLEKEYIINDFSPKHIISKVEDLEKYSLNNNFLRLQVENIDSSDLLDIKKSILEKNAPIEIEFTEKKKKESLPIQEDFDIAEGDVIDRFIKATGTDGLDEEQLKEIARNIMGD